MKKILVIGSINIDQVISVTKLPQSGETILGNSITYYPGGKGANQAVAIAKMNCNVKLLAVRGNDEWGNLCEASCKNFNVDISKIITNKNTNTGLASIYVQKDGLNSIVVLKGANNHLSKSIIDQNIDLIKECDFLVCQLETNNVAIFHAMKLAKQFSKKVILNPAPAKILSEKVLNNCDYLIPNESELAIISKMKIENKLDLKIAIEKLLKKSQHLEIIVTFGKKGVYYYDKNKKIIINFPALKTNVIDTTSAGDSFIGGFVSKISSNFSIASAIKFGIKVAAITVSKFGAQNSIPFFKEVNNETK